MRQRWRKKDVCRLQFYQLKSAGRLKKFWYYWRSDSWESCLPGKALIVCKSQSPLILRSFCLSASFSLRERERIFSPRDKHKYNNNFVPPASCASCTFLLAALMPACFLSEEKLPRASVSNYLPASSSTCVYDYCSNIVYYTFCEKRKVLLKSSYIFQQI